MRLILYACPFIHNPRHALVSTIIIATRAGDCLLIRCAFDWHTITTVESLENEDSRSFQHRSSGPERYIYDSVLGYRNNGCSATEIQKYTTAS